MNAALVISTALVLILSVGFYLGMHAIGEDKKDQSDTAHYFLGLILGTVFGLLLFATITELGGR